MSHNVPWLLHLSACRPFPSSMRVIIHRWWMAQPSRVRVVPSKPQTLQRSTSQRWQESATKISSEWLQKVRKCSHRWVNGASSWLIIGMWRRDQKISRWLSSSNRGFCSVARQPIAYLTSISSALTKFTNRYQRYKTSTLTWRLTPSTSKKI